MHRQSRNLFLCSSSSLLKLLMSSSIRELQVQGSTVPQRKPRTFLLALHKKCPIDERSVIPCYSPVFQVQSAYLCTRQCKPPRMQKCCKGRCCFDQELGSSTYPSIALYLLIYRLYSRNKRNIEPLPHTFIFISKPIKVSQGTIRLHLTIHIRGISKWKIPEMFPPFEI